MTGVDIASNLVEAGQRRAEAEGLSNISFEVGDARDLSRFPDYTFDSVLSIFGAMFAPEPTQVAAEMVRVTRPCGRIVMGNWIPGDPTLVAQVLRICAAYTPAPPEGLISPVTWGIEDTVRERFGAAGVAASEINCTRETYTFELDAPPRELLDRFRDYYGPTMGAYEAAWNNGRADELDAELLELIESQNTSSEPSRTSIPATYLRVEVNLQL